MKAGTIKINKKNYKFAFNQRARRLFMEKYGLLYWDDYVKKMELIKPHKTKGVSMPGMYVISDLIITAIESETPDFNDFDSDQLLDILLNEPGTMNEVMAVFTKAMEHDNANKKVGSSGSGPKSKGAK